MSTINKILCFVFMIISVIGNAAETEVSLSTQIGSVSLDVNIDWGNSVLLPTAGIGLMQSDQRSYVIDLSNGRDIHEISKAEDNRPIRIAANQENNNVLLLSLDGWISLLDVDNNFSIKKLTIIPSGFRRYHLDQNTVNFKHVGHDIYVIQVAEEIIFYSFIENLFFNKNFLPDGNLGGNMRIQVENCPMMSGILFYLSGSSPTFWSNEPADPEKTSMYVLSPHKEGERIWSTYKTTSDFLKNDDLSYDLDVFLCSAEEGNSFTFFHAGSFEETAEVFVSKVNHEKQVLNFDEQILLPIKQPVIAAITGYETHSFIIVDKTGHLYKYIWKENSIVEAYSIDLVNADPILNGIKRLYAGDNNTSAPEYNSDEILIRKIGNNKYSVLLGFSYYVVNDAEKKIEVVQPQSGSGGAFWKLKSSVDGNLLLVSMIGKSANIDFNTGVITRFDTDFAKHFERIFAINVPIDISNDGIVFLDINGNVKRRQNGVVTTIGRAQEAGIADPISICISQNVEEIVIVDTEDHLSILSYSNSSLELLHSTEIPLEGIATELLCSDDLAVIAIKDSISKSCFIVLEPSKNAIILKNESLCLSDKKAKSDYIRMSKNGKHFYDGSSLYSIDINSRTITLSRKTKLTEQILFDEDSLIFGTIDTKKNEFISFDKSVESFKLKSALSGKREIVDQIIVKKRYLVTIDDSLAVEGFDLKTGKSAFVLFTAPFNGWTIFTEEGRFDAYDLDDINDVHWIFSKQPQRAWPPELFVREYYEPELLRHIVKSENMRDIPSLSNTNRTQPIVEILSFDSIPGVNDEIIVNIKIVGIEQQIGKAETTRQSGAFDLRLFRDGRLIAQYPEVDVVQLLSSKGLENERSEWKEAHRIFDGVGNKKLSLRARLPHLEKGGETEFSTYAFNSDRVKSVISSKVYNYKADLPARPRRVYIIAVGVSAYEDPSWNLKYADDDARKLGEVLQPKLWAEYGKDNVVYIPLISNWDEITGEVTSSSATKKNIKVVFDVLAGKSVSRGDLIDIPNSDKLARVNPEDMVLFAFSGHGYTDPAGNFYAFPYDIGQNTKGVVSDNILKKSISSGEMSLWLKNIDADEIILVLDACYSAASVQNSEFRPGPLGSKGLGQLAYDKKMRILASSRIGEVAWESNKIQQGLLMYALVEEGLKEGKADFQPADNAIGVREWLQYAVERTPDLYMEAMNAKDVQLVQFDRPKNARDPIVIPVDDIGSVIQQPHLFDFRKDADFRLVPK